MPQSYNRRILDKFELGRTGILRKVVQTLYDDRLGILENTVTSESDFYYLDIPEEQIRTHDPEGYAFDRSNFYIWVDPDLDISSRDGDDPDEVILRDEEQYLVQAVDTQTLFNHGYKLVKLIKREVGAEMI